MSRSRPRAFPPGILLLVALLPGLAAPSGAQRAQVGRTARPTAPAAPAGLAYPHGTESFEALARGESVGALPGWSVRTDAAGTGFTATAVASGGRRRVRVQDTVGMPAPRGGTELRTNAPSRHLLVEGTPQPSGERVTGPVLRSPQRRDTRWSFELELLAPPPAGATGPSLAIECATPAGFEPLCGVELTSAGVSLFTTALAGVEARLPLPGSPCSPLDGAFAVRLELGLTAGVVRAAIEGGASVELPLAPATGADPARQRFALSGEGPGTVMDLLLDDVAVHFLRVAGSGRTRIGFEGLANGLALRGDELGAAVAVSAEGPNLGLAVFDSDPAGPNALGEDPDLLVDRGNLLILQSERHPAQSVPGVFDEPDDARGGGTFAFRFTEPVRLVSIDLVDLCPGSGQNAWVVLTDSAGRQRAYFVPAGFTNDIASQGPPGVATLDLRTRAPQAGVNATTSVSQAPAFDPSDVVSLDVLMGGSGAVDALVFLQPELGFPGRSYQAQQVEAALPVDLDGDGALDLVLADGYLNARLAVHPNRGDGILLPAALYPTGGRPQGVAAGDLDGDGDQDVVVTTVLPNALLVFGNDGMGNLVLAGTAPLPEIPRDVAVADLDGRDGPDVVVGPGSRFTFWVLRNLGGGTLGVPEPYSTGTSTQNEGFVLADFSGDGLPDFAGRSALNQFAVRINRGDGTFLPPTLFASQRPDGLAAGDVDGDGDEDLVVTAAPGEVRFHPNLGGGSFGAPVPFPVASSGPRVLRMGDLDGDGLPDLVVGSRGRVSVLPNLGGGAFGVAVPYVSSFRTDDLELGDLDGDGAPEVIVADPALSAATVLLNRGDGTLCARHDVPAGGASEDLVELDLEGDGDVDLAAANRGTADVYVYENRGDGTFEPPVVLPVGDLPRTLAAGDLDGNGSPDLVVADGQNELVLFVNDGGGGFVPGLRLATSGAPEWCGAFDLDADGDRDVVATITGFGGGVVVFWNAGDGSFPTQTFFVLRFAFDAAVGDLNADGSPDLAVTVPTVGALAILLNDGAGVLRSAAVIISDPAPNFVQTGDVDGDGSVDLVTTHNTPGLLPDQLFVHANAGNASFGVPTVYEVSNFPTRPVLADLDADGAVELVVGRNTAGVVAVFPNRGDGTFGTVCDYSATNGNATGVADLDGDGRPDVCVLGASLAILLQICD